MKVRLLILAIVAVVLTGLGWGAMKMVQSAKASPSTEIPTTKVRRGKVTITVAARGEMQGGKSEMLTAPMVGGGDIPITYLRQPGEVVQEGDVVAQFDTTAQEFNLREAESDLAEAHQQILKAEAEAQAVEEEDRYQTLKTAADVEIAELEVRKNPTLAAINAKQNDLSLEAARNRKRQADQDYGNRKPSSAASIAIQKAGENKAQVMADMARKQIESMVLKAKTGGYVNVQLNTNQNLMYSGMQLPQFQVGDAARAGQAVAQIPDMSNWEVVATIPEVDRGNLKSGQRVAVKAAALPGREFPGHIKSLGGTIGLPWDRKFECRIELDKTGAELRPGMSSNLVITVEVLDNVLWLPSQALFESDGRAFVYLRTPQGFVPQNMTLVRRGESQAVVAGLKEGDEVSLSNPDQQNNAGASQAGGALKALTR